MSLGNPTRLHVEGGNKFLEVGRSVKSNKFFTLRSPSAIKPEDRKHFGRQIDSSVRHYGGGKISPGRILPKQCAAARVQCIEILVARAEINHPIRHCRSGVH